MNWLGSILLVLGAGLAIGGAFYTASRFAGCRAETRLEGDDPIGRESARSLTRTRNRKPCWIEEDRSSLELPEPSVLYFV